MLRAHRAIKGTRALLVHKAVKAIRVSQVQPAHKVVKAIRVTRVQPAHKEVKAIRVTQAPQGHLYPDRAEKPCFIMDLFGKIAVIYIMMALMWE